MHRTDKTRWKPIAEIEIWKQQAAKARTINYPSVPPAITYPQHRSIFEPAASPTVSSAFLHIDDYKRFVTGVQDAASSRLDVRLNTQAIFSFSGPVIQPFPNCPPSLPHRIPPKPPSWFQRFINPADAQRISRSIEDVQTFNDWLDTSASSCYSDWNQRRSTFESARTLRQREWQEAKNQWDQARAREAKRLDTLLTDYQVGHGSQVTEYFLTQLHAVPIPAWCPRSYEVYYDEQQAILLLRLRIPFLRELGVSKTRILQSGSKYVPATKSESEKLKKDFSFLLLLRFMWEVTQIDPAHRVKGVACNAYVIYDDPATGRRREDTIMSVVADAERLRSIELHRVEPEACFRGLKGIAAAEILELVPVQPLINFDKNDSRFVDAKPVLDALGETNLAIMDWQDFEHLVRELFEKEFGSDVHITQASRDKGVDAVAFDPDPVRGGKYVIQAKRYIHTVDVSAVRDLFGTMINEGANRGILVTTSNYGRDAYEFAQGKPITLLNGANLLHLLMKHGYHCRIDLGEVGI